MRWIWLGMTLLMAGCSGGSTGPSPDIVGFWLVTTVNGQAVPAPTESGRTLYHGTLELLTTGSGLVTTCTGFPNAVEEQVTAVFWAALPTAGHLQVTYPPDGVTLDTAQVTGNVMTWEPSGEEARLGTSHWTLTRTTDAATPCP